MFTRHRTIPGRTRVAIHASERRPDDLSSSRTQTERNMLYEAIAQYSPHTSTRDLLRLLG